MLWENTTKREATIFISYEIVFKVCCDLLFWGSGLKKPQVWGLCDSSWAENVMLKKFMAFKVAVMNDSYISEVLLCYSLNLKYGFLGHRESQGQLRYGKGA